MRDYKNLNGTSNILAFEIRQESIIVKFRSNYNSAYDTYEYTYRSAGPNNIEYMKRLALAGFGLSTFISTNIKKLYEHKWLDISSYK